MTAVSWRPVSSYLSRARRAPDHPSIASALGRNKNDILNATDSVRIFLTLPDS